MKNRGRALALVEMPMSPEWIFIILLICSQAWSAPMDTKGMLLLVTDIYELHE